MTITTTGVRRLATDFNERKNGLLFAFFEGIPMPDGERVELYDSEGNSCLGVVWETRGLLVAVLPNMATWADGWPPAGEQKEEK